MSAENDLSERELEILKLVATGASNKEIAQILVISPNTVKVHLRNVFSKIGVVSRTEATLYAIKIGLIHPEGSQSVEISTGTVDEVQSNASENENRRSRNTRQIVASAIGLALLVSILLLLTVFRPNNASQDPTADLNRWENAAVLPEARSDMAVEQYEGSIYIISGRGPEGLSAQVQVYDIVTDTWKELMAKPTPVTAAQAGVVGENIYVPGGEDTQGKPTRALEVFNPRENIWSHAADLPYAVSRYALASFEGKLYLFGGWDGKQVLSQILVYDPLTDQWEQLQTTPTPIQNAAAAALGSKIYLIGGDDGAQATVSTWTFYPNRETAEDEAWVKKPDLPEPRSGVKASVLNNAVYITGDLSSEQSSAAPVLRFNELDNQWEQLDSSTLTLPLRGMGIIASDTKIHLLGGILNDLPSDIHASYQAVYTVRLPAVSK